MKLDDNLVKDILDDLIKNRDQYDDKNRFILLYILLSNEAIENGIKDMIKDRINQICDPFHVLIFWLEGIIDNLEDKEIFDGVLNQKIFINELKISIFIEKLTKQQKIISFLDVVINVLIAYPLSRIKWFIEEIYKDKYLYITIVDYLELNIDK